MYRFHFSLQILGYPLLATDNEVINRHPYQGKVPFIPVAFDESKDKTYPADPFEAGSSISQSFDIGRSTTHRLMSYPTAVSEFRDIVMTSICCPDPNMGQWQRRGGLPAHTRPSALVVASDAMTMVRGNSRTLDDLVTAPIPPRTDDAAWRVPDCLLLTPRIW